MRAGLTAALEAAQGHDEAYPAGSVVICAHCFLPLYALTRTIWPGEKTSRTVDAYRPLSAAQIQMLRQQVPSVQSALKPWTDQDVARHAEHIPELRTGSAALCPSCGRSFVQVFAPSGEEVIDQAYTWRLVTIPASGPVPIRSAEVRA